MNWSDFKELEKSMWEDKSFNLFEKVFNAAVMVPVLFGIDKADEATEKMTGKGIIERKAESLKKEEEEKEKHPLKWAGKKIIEGAVGGVIGTTIKHK